jgi:drug/metabolite transporter (DMT)-like permease
MRTASLAISSPNFRIPLPLMVAAFCLLWSLAFSVAKVALADCPPLLLLTFRFLLAGIVMLGAAALTGVSLKMSRRDLMLFAALGVANQAAYLGISYVGLKSISSGLSALVISANPVLTAVLAAAFLGERMTWRKALGLVLGVGGVTFVVQSRLSGGLDHAGGIIFTLIALVSLVIGTILFKRFAPSGGLWVGNGVQSLSAGLAVLPSPSRSRALATSSRPGGLPPQWPSWCCWSRCSPICCGSSCSSVPVRRRRARITS